MPSSNTGSWIQIASAQKWSAGLPCSWSKPGTNQQCHGAFGSCAVRLEFRDAPDNLKDISSQHFGQQQIKLKYQVLKTRIFLIIWIVNILEGNINYMFLYMKPISFVHFLTFFSFFFISKLNSSLCVSNFSSCMEKASVPYFAN